MKKNLLFIMILLLTFKTEAQTSVLKATDSILETGNYQTALAELEKINEPSSEILEKIASIYQKVGNNSKAIEYYDKAFVIKPTDKIKEQLGKSYQSIGNPDKTIELYNEVLQTNPNNLLLKYNLAKLYMSEKKVKKAIELFNELSNKDSLNPNYPYQLGIAYEKLGKSGFANSANSFLKAYKIDSLHLKSIYNLAKFYRKLKFKDSATLFIDKGLKINPKSINFNQLKANDAFLNKEFDSALVYLKKLEDLNFKTMFTYKMYGLTYLNMKNYKKAEEYFKVAQGEDYKDASVAYNLGLVEKGMKNYKKASYYFAMSIYYQKPKLDKNYYQLGLMQLEQKEMKIALKSFEDGYKNNWKNHQLLFQLAMTSDDYYKDKKIALQHFEKYIDSFSDRDKKSTLYAKQRIKEIKKKLFMDGEKID
ncbi:MAG: tetratricopeptide repeat protein [Flavobacteriaceae bacterium]|nr:tetratricopeptide repeat protein [Flavobacteriaceae bacterium]